MCTLAYPFEEIRKLQSNMWQLHDNNYISWGICFDAQTITFESGCWHSGLQRHKKWSHKANPRIMGSIFMWCPLHWTPPKSCPKNLKLPIYLSSRWWMNWLDLHILILLKAQRNLLNSTPLHNWWKQKAWNFFKMLKLVRLVWLVFLSMSCWNITLSLQKYMQT